MSAGTRSRRSPQGQAGGINNDQQLIKTRETTGPKNAESGTITASLPGENEKSVGIFLQWYHLVYAIIPIVVIFLSLIWYHNIRLNAYGLRLEEIKNMDQYITILKEMDKHVPLLESKVKTINRDVESVKQSFDPLSQKMSEIEGKQDAASSKLDKLETQIDKINRKTNKLRTIISGKEQQFTRVIETALDMEPKINSQQELIEKLEVKVVGIEQKLNPVVDVQTKLEENIRISKEDTKVLLISLEEAKSSLSEIKDKMQQYNDSIQYVNKAVFQMRVMESNVDHMGKAVTNLNSNITLLQKITNSTKDDVGNFSQKASILQSSVQELSSTTEDLKTCQTNIEKDITSSQTQLKGLQEDVSKSDTHVQDLKENLKETEKNMLAKIDKTNSDISDASERVRTEIGKYNLDIENLTSRVNNEEQSTLYMEKTVPLLVADVNSLKDAASFSWRNVLEVFEVLVIVAILVFLWKPELFKQNKDSRHNMSPAGDMPSAIHRNIHQRPKNILDQIQRVPVLDNNICVLSFYSETQKLHRSLVDSAMEHCRRGRSMQVEQFLVRKHEDILQMPKARYIMIFVDFNERNVILENPGQDLGDKKLVTVQAAQKLGADVFVTYVRDKGSSNLFVGHLYNSELSAFTAHGVLKKLEAKGRCFSVYEKFTNSQKEHIANAIK